MGTGKKKRLRKTSSSGKRSHIEFERRFVPGVNFTTALWRHVTVFFALQKERQARVNKAKNASRAAYMNNRKKAEQMILAWQSGVSIDPANVNIFDVQINHLLMCLENTMVS